MLLLLPAEGVDGLDEGGGGRPGRVKSEALPPPPPPPPRSALLLRSILRAEPGRAGKAPLLLPKLLAELLGSAGGTLPGVGGRGDTRARTWRLTGSGEGGLFWRGAKALFDPFSERGAGAGAAGATGRLDEELE